MSLGGSTGLIDTSLRVNTTKAKIRVLRTLSGYWRVKGRFLQNKLDPSYGARHPEMYTDVAEYIDEFTDLPHRCSFWKALSQAQRELFCRSLVYGDEAPTKFSAVGSEQTAMLCIVLNGFVHVKSSLSPGVTTTYAQGESFGEVFHFDELTRFEVAGRPSYDPLVVNRPDGLEESLEVVMEKGALLRISMDCFRTHVWGHAPSEPVDEDADTRTDEEISGIAKELMTKADFECVRVHRAAKRKLASLLYDFMTHADLLPKNAHTATERASMLKFGAKGSNAFVNSNTIYIVIEGSMRVEICKRGPKVKRASIGTANPLDSESVVRYRVNKLPLSVMEAGTILFLKDDCFTVGQDSALLPSGAMKPQFRTLLEAARDAGILPSSSTTNQHLLQPKRDKKGRVLSDGIKTDILYHLATVFEKPTVYLEIPEYKFRMAMEECPAQTVETFEAQLEHSTHSIFARIVKLLTWIQGQHYGIEPDDEVREEALDEDKRPDPLDYALSHDAHADAREDSLKGTFHSLTLTELYKGGLRFYGQKGGEPEAAASPSPFLTT